MSASGAHAADERITLGNRVTLGDGVMIMDTNFHGTDDFMAASDTAPVAIGDLGVRTAMRKAYQLEELPAPAQMETIAAAWRPYSSVAMWYLWRSLDTAAQI